MTRLDLSALEIFRQVAREGSISRAAISLNRVQSNISTRVKQIEEQVGTQLFERGHRGMKLTPNGRVLLGYADELLNLSERAVDAVGNGTPSGVLTIGTMESTAASRLPAILSRYHRCYPKVNVHVRTGTAGALLEQLMDSRVDVAFVAEPVEHDSLERIPVFEENLMLLSPNSASGSGPGALSGKTVIAFEEGCAYRRYLDQWLLETGAVSDRTISIGSYLGMFACISAGTGFGVAPKSVLDALAVGGNFDCSELGGRYARIRTMMVWRKGYESSNLSELKNLLL